MVNKQWWLSLASVLIGIWVILAEVFYKLSTVEFWNSFVVGGAIVIFAGYSMSRSASELGRVLNSGLAALFGVWLIGTPWTIGVSGSLQWSWVVSGLLVAVLSGTKTYFVLQDSGEEVRPDSATIYQSN